jgi:hypothetical protein
MAPRRRRIVVGLTEPARRTDAEDVRVIASPEAVEFIRDRGGQLFVWPVTMEYGYGRDVFVLEASTDSPGAERPFRRFAGTDFDVLLDTGEREPPEELHVDVKGWRRRTVRAYWNRQSFAT